MWRAVEFVVWQKRSAIVCPAITNFLLGKSVVNMVRLDVADLQHHCCI
jgi:hypothetical protein